MYFCGKWSAGYYFLFPVEAWAERDAGKRKNEKKKERKSQTEKSTELDSAAYEQNHGNAEARFGAENTAAGESFESAAETVDGSAFERDDSDIAANETASESQNELEANESADTVSEEPEEEILEEWKD